MIIIVLAYFGLNNLAKADRSLKEDILEQQYEERSDPADIEAALDNQNDTVTIICEKLREMDFTAKQPHMNVSPEENRLYLEGYLKVLKNETLTIDSWENEYYYKDLWMAGIEFDELLEAKDQREYPYLYYYEDLDGDGKPEFAIEQGCMYIFKYELGEDKIRVIHIEQACYFEKMVGTGQIWYHDGLHVGVVRDRLIVLNEQNVGETVLALEQVISPDWNYYMVDIGDGDRADIGKENWDELITPFFEMVENNELPRMTLEEVFGELLE